jgi:hypothetical protein
MRLPHPTITPTTPPPTAAEALHLTHGNLYAALGAVCVLAWFVIHRFAAHRHPVAEWIAKICLLAGGVVLAVCVGVVAKWVANINNATANWMSGWFGDPTFSAKHWGVLTVLAVIDVVFVATTTWDLVRHMSGKKGAGGSGKMAQSHWGSLEHTANKYGWIGLGPLAATLPNPFGLWVVTWLTLLSEAIAHTLGHLFGMG